MLFPGWAVPSVSDRADIFLNTGEFVNHDNSQGRLEGFDVCCVAIFTLTFAVRHYKGTTSWVVTRMEKRRFFAGTKYPPAKPGDT